MSEPEAKRRYTGKNSKKSTNAPSICQLHLLNMTGDEVFVENFDSKSKIRDIIARLHFTEEMYWTEI